MATSVSVILFGIIFSLNFTFRSSEDRSQFHLLEDTTLSSSQSNDFSPLNMDLMGDLQDVIFRNYYTVPDENDNKSTVYRSKVSN